MSEPLLNYHMKTRQEVQARRRRTDTGYRGRFRRSVVSGGGDITTRKEGECGREREVPLTAPPAQWSKKPCEEEHEKRGLPSPRVKHRVSEIINGEAPPPRVESARFVFFLA